ncbi:hypothetical protein JTB14_020656 [Gonioctena quinquepunctata]|nr:hypothetical protein JTB14_020656 [Gonioctena quinquepunctata]
MLLQRVFCDSSVRKVFLSFKQQFPSFIGSYDLYRIILKQKNISFVKLGHEEYEDCEYFLLHNKDHRKDNLAPDCAICQHIKKADKSRTRYKEYAGREPVEEEIVFSVDLEKVIMLPRCDIFTEDYRIQWKFRSSRYEAEGWNQARGCYLAQCHCRTKERKCDKYILLFFSPP